MINLRIFKAISPIFQNDGMKMDIDNFCRFIQYNETSETKLTYEEYLKVSMKDVLARKVCEIDTNKLLKVAENGLNILSKFKGFRR